MAMVGFNDFGGVGFIIEIVLMGDGDKRSSGGVDGKVEIAADVGVGAGDDLEVVLGGEMIDMAVWSSSSDDDLARVILVYDRFDALLEVGALSVGKNNEGVNRTICHEKISCGRGACAEGVQYRWRRERSWR